MLQFNYTTERAKRPGKHLTKRCESEKFSDDSMKPRKIGWDSKNTGKKRRAPEKAGEHQKREELFSSTEKRWRASGKSGEAKEKSGVSFTTPEKGEELQKKSVNTGRRRSSGTTPRKCGALPEKLVKSEKTPEKDGETPGKSGEPGKWGEALSAILLYLGGKGMRIILMRFTEIKYI